MTSYAAVCRGLLRVAVLPLVVAGLMVSLLAQSPDSAETLAQQPPTFRAGTTVVSFMTIETVLEDGTAGVRVIVRDKSSGRVGSLDVPIR
jgi:hypothetical protein